ncbi:MAG: UbiX family flavin prenyltransferase [Candidatus Merdivicinus sp.]|jgi:4-hydroxy-3-polyprenylbenzoate decarboxylase
MKNKRLVIAATGASGAPLLVRCLEILRAHPDFESHLIVSRGASLTLEQETSLSESDLRKLADVCYEPDQIGAAPASGSFRTEGMLIVPCSMKTAAGIHCGYADSLILRAADVTIKEQRKLVLAVRESPLSPIHLQNLLDLSRIPGVRIAPPMLTFYHNPQSIDDMLTQSAARLLEPFGIETEGFRPWNGLSPAR